MNLINLKIIIMEDEYFNLKLEGEMQVRLKQVYYYTFPWNEDVKGYQYLNRGDGLDVDLWVKLRNSLRDLPLNGDVR